MKDLNKQFLEGLEVKLNATTGLTKSAEIIEKSKARIASTLNDLFDDTDKPILKKVKKAYEKKLTTFETALPTVQM